VPISAEEKAQDALDADPYSGRLINNLAQIREAAGDDATYQYQNLLRLQPTLAANWLNYAESLVRRGGAAPDGTSAARLYDEAVKLDPNDTEIRISRGHWKLDNNDLSGWKDIEHIAELAEQPYGKYPATPEMVDLNFARAYALLAERDKVKDKTAALNWAVRGAQVIADGRKYEADRQKMEQATEGEIDHSREQAMNELEAEFKDIKRKLDRGK
jgi:hypothetical protein